MLAPCSLRIRATGMAIAFHVCFMSHNRCMARGQSGRLVFEIDPGMKREFHARLARDGSSAKDWLIRRIQDYLARDQNEFHFVTNESEENKRKSS